MKIVNTTGVLPNGKEYKMKFITKFSNALQQTHLFLTVKTKDSFLEEFFIDKFFSSFYNPKTESYAKALKDVLLQAEKEYNLNFLKADLKVA